jgi:hypothetical protein
MEAQQSFPEYRIGAVARQSGIVTLLFTHRNGGGAFAVALRASGTWLSTSVASVRLDQATLVRVRPVTAWWQNADLPARALTACTDAMPGEAIGDPAAALQVAAEAALSVGEPPALDSIWGIVIWFVTLLGGATTPGCFPRSVALALALFQVAVVVAAISRGISIDASPNGPGPPSSSAPAFSLERRVSWITLLMIAACALVAVHRVGGPSAAVWVDTLNDQAEVQRCLERSQCTMYGMGTSVPGLLRPADGAASRPPLRPRSSRMTSVLICSSVAGRDVGGVRRVASRRADRSGLGHLDDLKHQCGWVNYRAVHPIILPFLGAVYLVACARG